MDITALAASTGSCSWQQASLALPSSARRPATGARAKYRDSAEEKIANNLMGVGGHFVSAFNSSVMFAKAQTKVPDCAPDRMVLMGGGGQLRGFRAGTRAEAPG